MAHLTTFAGVAVAPIVAGRLLHCPRCFRQCGERTVRGTVYIIAHGGKVELELVSGELLRRCPGRPDGQPCHAVIRLQAMPMTSSLSIAT